jgi:hypothetical protein
MRKLCQKLANGKDTIASSELADAFDRFAFGNEMPRKAHPCEAAATAFCAGESACAKDAAN